MAGGQQRQLIHAEKDSIVDFTSLDGPLQDLINQASHARSLAYCPYSNFPVGAALRSAKGSIITGCNVENASYGLSICAERTALVKAVSMGEKLFDAIAVVANLDNRSDFVAPCGACRQFIAEFGTDIVVYLAKTDLHKVLITSAAELLPLNFHF